MFFTYILYSKEHDSFYVGSCEDLTKRLNRHNSKQVKSTKGKVPWIFVYTEEYQTRAEALVSINEGMTLGH